MNSKLKNKLKDELIDRLFEAILLLENIDECYSFFEDVCTIAEIKAMAQRLEVAKMLKNKRTYQEIGEETGASTATISRVNRCLNYGADGYRLILERLENMNPTKQE
jgi:TrpR-related protein YerC/YecD